MPDMRGYNRPVRFDPKIHHRHSIRLQGYDYSQAGAYFVTIVAWQREMLFGEIVNGEMDLNRHGQIVLNAWMDFPNHYHHAESYAACAVPKMPRKTSRQIYSIAHFRLYNFKVGKSNQNFVQLSDPSW
jgi:hypothetical protein